MACSVLLEKRGVERSLLEQAATVLSFYVNHIILNIVTARFFAYIKISVKVPSFFLSLEVSADECIHQTDVLKLSSARYVQGTEIDVLIVSLQVCLLQRVLLLLLCLLLFSFGL